MGNRASLRPFMSLQSPQGIQNPGEVKTTMELPVTAEANKIKVVLRLESFEPIAYISLPIQAPKTNEAAREVFNAISGILRHSNLAVQLPRGNEIGCRLLTIDPTLGAAQNPADTLYSLVTRVQIAENLMLDHNCIYSVLVYPREAKKKYLYQSPNIANDLVSEAELIQLPCKWSIARLNG